QRAGEGTGDLQAQPFISVPFKAHVNVIQLGLQQAAAGLVDGQVGIAQVQGSIDLLELWPARLELQTALLQLSEQADLALLRGSTLYQGTFVGKDNQGYGTGKLRLGKPGRQGRTHRRRQGGQVTAVVFCAAAAQRY